MHTFEKVGASLFVAACLCVGYSSYFFLSENPLAFLVLMAIPILGIAGIALLLKSPKLKKPLLLFLTAYFGYLALSNLFSKF
jgi:hypothetical protein